MANVVNGVHEFSEEEKYVVPTRREVLENLEIYQDKKLGFMMHWAPVGQLGTYESWPLCDEASKWSQEDIDWTSIEEFKEQYEFLPNTFNPVKFRPDRWAAWAKSCGFQYLLFTTKHHDGFCMYDTETTDYKITNPAYPFSRSKYADIVGSLFHEFRAQGMSISAYFSKPDWHDNNYWHKEFGVSKTRSVNYDIDEYPELWEQFVQRTHKQLEEICSKYGRIDLLWLDGGWVRPDNLKQDIRLGEVVEQIRDTTQPHLICVDRTVGGAYENVITPEQEIPDHAILVPWEACITAGSSFSFHYDDKAKTGLQLTKIFLDIISKGGNLALNVTPRPDGMFPKNQVQAVTDFGLWVQRHKEGIFGTRAIAPYQHDRVYYTQKAAENKIYAFYLFDEVPHYEGAVTVEVHKNVTSVRLLRRDAKVRFRQQGTRLVIYADELSTCDAFFADGFELTCDDNPIQ